jgi:hypothetical protein
MDEIRWIRLTGLVSAGVEEDIINDELMFNVDMRLMWSSRAETIL